MVVCFVLFCLFVCLLQLCPILAYCFLIEALIELRKMLLRKKLFDVRFGNCLTPEGTKILQIYWIYKDAIDLTSR